MGNNDMGKVLTEANIANMHDLLEANLGKIPADQVRRIKIPDALVDSGATPWDSLGSSSISLGLGNSTKKEQ